ncbi:hypothetical protein TanjilG_16860 [Lupinus angustifolius]|uniref:Uncharacterized protein n=1 Tax=Lupinus angustifolius TaxID=3871 RepID=A0A394DFZ0_LUPAN|nr:hypothetical protein TanjilG_16860 [Lupinus angustifolius]
MARQSAHRHWNKLQQNILMQQNAEWTLMHIYQVCSLKEQRSISNRLMLSQPNINQVLDHLGLMDVDINKDKHGNNNAGRIIWVNLIRLMIY